MADQPYEGLRDEHELLLRLARFRLDADQQARVREILERRRADLDWGMFVDQASRHRVLPLVAHNLCRHGLHRDAGTGRLVVPYWWLFDGAVRANGERNAVLRQEYGTVLHQLVEAEVPHAVRKGPAVAEHLYPDPALRITRDLDILVAKADLPRFTECLTACGYTQDRTSAKAPAGNYSRRAQLFWQMYLPNELPFAKVGTYAGIDWFVVDPVTSPLHAAARRDVDVAAVLSRARRGWLHGAYGYLMDWADWLVDLSVHLYEEAVALHHINRGKDLRLQKFLDLAAICGAMPPDAWPRFGDRVAEWNVAAEVYYALHFTAMLYPGAVPADALDPLRPADTGYLDEYGGPDGAPGRWSRPFLDRLFDPLRGQQVAGASPVPTA